MGQVALPYTLQNGATADATQVMANLQALVAAINGNLDHTNLKADSQGLAQVANALLQIMQAVSGLGAIGDTQIAQGQQLVWGNDVALYRIGPGVLGLKSGTGAIALGPLMSVLGASVAQKVQYTTATLPANATSVTVTFPTAFSGTPLVWCQMQSTNALQIIPESASTSGFTAYTYQGQSNASSQVFNYLVIGN